MENNELFQIGEVSRLFHISVSILRYYDKIGLVKPEYTDPDTGYRYYSTRQFECLNTIRYLRALDMPLEKISTFLQNRNIDSIHELLQKQKEEVGRRRQELSLIERKIDNRLMQITDALSSRLDQIKVVQKPARLDDTFVREIGVDPHRGCVVKQLAAYSLRQHAEYFYMPVLVLVGLENRPYAFLQFLPDEYAHIAVAGYLFVLDTEI